MYDRTVAGEYVVDPLVAALLLVGCKPRRHRTRLHRPQCVYHLNATAQSFRRLLNDAKPGVEISV
jgi:hypothetical protein